MLERMLVHCEGLNRPVASSQFDSDVELVVCDLERAIQRAVYTVEIGPLRDDTINGSKAVTRVLYGDCKTIVGAHLDLPYPSCSPMSFPRYGVRPQHE